MASTDRLRALAQPPLVEAGLRLWDVEIVGDVVRVLVDRDGGVDLDALTDASRVVSELLDAHEDLTPPGPYQLEVSSPGLERTLRTPEQYRQYLGATVTVKTVAAVEGSRRHRGVLVSADADAIGIIPDAAPGSAATAIPYDVIERARTVLDWGPAPKPGSRPKAARTRSDIAASSSAIPSAGGSARDHKDRLR
jgi:ribosome maturation factor RimP